MSTTATAPRPTGLRTTEALISQLALGATWSHLDDERPDPVQAAVEVLGATPDPAVMAEIAGTVASAADLDWTEQVAYALHLLLTSEDAPALLAA